MSLVSSQRLGIPLFSTSQVWSRCVRHHRVHNRYWYYSRGIQISKHMRGGSAMSANKDERDVAVHKKKTASSGKTGEDQGPMRIKPVFYTPDGKLIEQSSLSSVVSDAVKRWYHEAEKEAQRGDVKAMALLGQMLMEGYGCEVDVERGKQLTEKARRRGYRMHRVYCEI